MIDVRKHDDVTVLELAHGKANALDLELCRRVADVLDDLERDGAPAIVITGRGRIFSAGVDLKRLLDGGADYAREFVPVLTDALRGIFEYPGPVVAAINGHAVAGGCVLASAADRRIMSDSGGRVGIPELRVGVPFPASAIEIMRSTLAPSRLRALVYGGITLDARSAVDWGLIDQIVPAESLLETAVAAAADLARIPAGAFSVSKAQIRLPALERMDIADTVAGEQVMELWTAPATFDAVRGYVERTLNRGS